MDEVNKYLKEHKIEPITNAENYLAAVSALHIIGRKDDENKLTQIADP